jgi:RNA polymerase sigma-70 factor (ECF subfamily)
MGCNREVRNLRRPGATLISQIQARDQQALEALYDQLAPLVHALILRTLGDKAEAEEVLGETFWQVWRDAETYDPSRGTLEGWVITIARSRALDRLRIRKRQEATQRASSGQESPAVPTRQPSMPETIALQGERARAISAALQSLSEEQRLPIELAYYEGLSGAEIAHRLAQPHGTIKSRIRLGLLRLRNVLEPYLGDNA